MFDSEDFWTYSDVKFYHFLNDKIEGNSYDKPIILVKQKYLDKLKQQFLKTLNTTFILQKLTITLMIMTTFITKNFGKKKKYLHYLNL